MFQVEIQEEARALENTECTDFRAMLAGYNALI